MKKTWKNVELKESADKFRTFLKENEIRYEASYAGYGYTHFEVYVNNTETEMCDAFLNQI